MSRPTRYCYRCGEYVGMEDGRLAHIDADGRVIHRGHAPVLEEERRPGDVMRRGRIIR